MTKAAGVVGLWTVSSRVLGFVRDMITALFLGAGPGADAFFVAFRIPNLLRRLFAEGALSAAFIPIYCETIQKKGHAEAARLAAITFTFAAIALAVITLLGMAFSPFIVSVIAPGFAGDPSKLALTVSLNRIMFPYIFFISLVALASGALNSLGHFGAPAAAPNILNLCMIGSVLIFSGNSGTPAYYALAWGVVVSGVLQLALQIPFLRSHDVTLRPSLNFRHPELRRIGRLFVPAAFSGAVYQINVLLGTVLASLLPVGGVSWLYYADRVVELPLGVFAIALGTAVLPSMSRQAGAGDLAGLSRSTAFALRLIAFFTIPASIALVILRVPIIAVLFQRGLFTFRDTLATATALLGYTVGLWAFSGLKVITQAFFSLKDTKTPLWVAIISVTVNVTAGVLMLKPWGHGGLALATSLAAAVNIVLLFRLLMKRLPIFPARELTVSLGKISAAAAVMGLFLLYVSPFGDWSLGLTMRNALVLGACIAGGALVFFGCAVLFRCREVQSMIGILKGRL